jgi:hypothetical protein
MDMASFNELLEMVTPLIKKRDTLMRNSISPDERLALTLCCLATGELIISLFLKAAQLLMALTIH